ncbi:MAG TPA: ABC transporter permease [Candidatus Onthocola stercorigallinarum]|nr:ABC transporter permease [Candidatus Onthocola stercorigallinarum]
MKLVKNELYKILHKRSTKVFLVIALIFVILTNLIYRYSDDLLVFSTTYYEDYDMALSYVNDYENSGIGDKELYNYYKSFIETYDLANNYDSNSWQYQKYMEDYWNLLQEYYRYLDEELDAPLISNELEETKNNIENNNWQYFVNNDTNNINESINNIKNSLNSSLSNNEKINYEKELFILEEQLKLNEYRIENDVAFGNDYLNDAINAINNSLYSMAEYQYSNDVDYQDSVKSYYENWYILDNKVDTNNNQTLRSVFVNFFNEYSFLILVFGIMIAGGIVSDEFNKGTIKSLLIIPHKRSKILLAKYISVLIMLLFIIGIFIVSELLIGGILMGFGSLSIPVVVYNITDSCLEVLNIFGYLILQILANLPQIILLVTLAFACSVIVNSTAFSIVIPFCGIIASELINGFALVYDIKILNYFVTTNWDFTVYLFGGTSIYGNSLIHAIIVCLVYLLIMLVVTFIVFKKKDIKNI